MANQARADSADHQLTKTLGYWSLVATGIGSVIGSGWLLSAQSAADFAGPAALISWIIGGGLMLMIALVFAELGMVRPESGGLVRYPLYSNGRLTASIIGWAMWLSYVGNPPSEASAVVQYASSWWGGVYDTGAKKLTPLGIGVCIALMAVFVVINYLGVEAFARANNAITSIKVLIPTITVILLIASGFTNSKAGGLHDNIKATGFAPYGWSASLGAIAAGGLIFAYTGFRNIVELSGEARDPRRDIPRAMITTIAFAIVLYLLLQISFLGSVPGSQIAAKAGWHGVNFSSPFADIAKLLGITWLYWLLIADSSISPSGSGIVYTAANSRNVFGLAKNGFFPKSVMRINKNGVPGLALLINFVIGIAFLLPLPSWQAIVEVMSAMAALTFSIGSVSVMVFRNVGLGDAGSRLPGMRLIAPAAFVVSTLVIFWESWDKLWKTIPIVAVGVIWYGVTYALGQRDRRDLAGGVWLVVYLVITYGLASMSSFGGRGIIPAPYDSVLVGAVALAIYLWAVRAGTRFLSGHDELLEVLGHRPGRTSEPETDGPVATA